MDTNGTITVHVLPVLLFVLCPVSRTRTLGSRKVSEKSWLSRRRAAAGSLGTYSRTLTLLSCMHIRLCSLRYTSIPRPRISTSMHLLSCCLATKWPSPLTNHTGVFVRGSLDPFNVLLARLIRRDAACNPSDALYEGIMQLRIQLIYLMNLRLIYWGRALRSTLRHLGLAPLGLAGRDVVHSLHNTRHVSGRDVDLCMQNVFCMYICNLFCKQGLFGRGSRVY